MWCTETMIQASKDAGARKSYARALDEKNGIPAKRVVDPLLCLALPLELLDVNPDGFQLALHSRL